jgi:hypothetical protein
MRAVNMGLVVSTFLTGVVAAAYWYRSSRIQPRPTWRIEPGDGQLSQSGWLAGTLQAFSDAAALNAKAAGWTAVSVALAAISSLVGIFANR